MSLKFRGSRGDGHQQRKCIGGLLRKNQETKNDNIEKYIKGSKVKKGKKKNLKKIDAYAWCKTSAGFATLSAMIIFSCNEKQF